MRIGSSRSSIGVWVLAALLVSAGAAWTQPPVLVHGNTQGQVSTAALYNAVAAYAAVATTPAVATASKSTPQEEYHAKMQDPNLSWVEKCKLALRHERLEHAWSDAGGPLRGRLEYGRSVLAARVICDDKGKPIILTFYIPTNFVVATSLDSDDLAGKSFNTVMYSIDGTATDVPGFASITLRGGSSRGMGGSGRTSLVAAGDNTWVVDSTFNIGYTIDWVGADGGPLAGGSGSFSGTAVMKAYGSE